MVGVMKRVEDNSYLEQRGRVWWYNRRVPRKFAHLDTRKRIKVSFRLRPIDFLKSFIIYPLLRRNTELFSEKLTDRMNPRLVEP